MLMGHPKRSSVDPSTEACSSTNKNDYKFSTTYIPGAIDLKHVTISQKPECKTKNMI